MKFWTDLRIKVRDFFKKHKRKIYIAFIILFLVIFVNSLLEPGKEVIKRITTYEPHVSIMDDNSSVPEKLQTPIEETIDKFINYCNKKEYGNAYDLLTEECKEVAYSTIDDFKKYVNVRFPNKKLYAIQNYSNLNKKYIYQIKIFDDYLASGLTNQEYSYYDEKITVVEENNEIKLSIGKFIEKVDIKNVAEDDYLKIDIKYKILNYDTETYHVKITNRSEYTAVIADNTVGFGEIILDLGKEYRNREDNYLSNIILSPGEVQEYDLTFPKFYDDGDTSQNLVFNAIRIIRNYDGDSLKEENSITKYSIKMKV